MSTACHQTLWTLMPATCRQMSTSILTTFFYLLIAEKEQHLPLHHLASPVLQGSCASSPKRDVRIAGTAGETTRTTLHKLGATLQTLGFNVEQYKNFNFAVGDLSGLDWIERSGVITF